MDTIFALSSGRPPAAIAVVRISGPNARGAAKAMIDRLPQPRKASLRTLRDMDGSTLDHALVLVFPGPDTATGEDLVELHLHGGRAVVNAVLARLAAMDGLRFAEAGEFTRRALMNGRIDLGQAQGLADLLEAESDDARRAALAAAEGEVSRTLRQWMDELSLIGALVEAAIDHSDEDDVGSDTLPMAIEKTRSLALDIDAVLSRPSVERLRDGPTIVLAGPPNAGKSSLFNALLERDAAIVTPIAGTTRDVLEAAVLRRGMSYRLIDTAGLARVTNDPVEAIGVERADTWIAAADLVLWLGDPSDAPTASLAVHARADDRPPPADVTSLAVSVHDRSSIDRLWSRIERSAAFRGSRDLAYFHDEARTDLAEVRASLLRLDGDDVDPLIAAEELRSCRNSVANLLGLNPTEAMLDALFGRFCIGK